MFKRKKQADNNKMRHLITKLNPKSPISEQFRTIRTNLQFSSIDDPLKSILVSSAGPGAGKSITSANLAVVYAQQGMKVLLVDADMRKPTVHYTFRLANLRGFSNVLVGDSTLEATVERTDVENLHVLSSGPIPPNPSELLASRRMIEVLDSMKEFYDVVIFDTPPTLAVTDAKVLSSVVDGTLMVVRSGATNMEDAKRAIDILKDSPAKFLGAVLNDREKTKSNHYYYYGA